MNKAYVFLAGEIRDYKKVKNYIENENIYGADGGGNHIFHIGMKPKMLLGDFDSIDKDVYEKFHKDTIIKSFSIAKDYSDGELIIKEIYKEYDEIIIFGALGGRSDHSFVNLFLLEKYPKCKIINEDEILFYLNNEYKFTDNLNKRISFLPLADENIIDLKGFWFDLDEKFVPRGSSLTLSNEIRQGEAFVKVLKGSFIAIKEI